MVKIPFRPKPALQANIDYNRVLHTENAKTDLQQAAGEFEQALRKHSAQLKPGSRPRETEAPRAIAELHGDVQLATERDIAGAQGPSAPADGPADVRDKPSERYRSAPERGIAQHSFREPGMGPSLQNIDQLPAARARASDLRCAGVDDEGGAGADTLPLESSLADAGSFAAAAVFSTPALQSAIPEQTLWAKMQAGTAVADDAVSGSGYSNGVSLGVFATIDLMWQHYDAMEMPGTQTTWQFSLQRGDAPVIGLSVRSGARGHWSISVQARSGDRETVEQYLLELRESLAERQQGVVSIVVEAEAVS